MAITSEGALLCPKHGGMQIHCQKCQGGMREKVVAQQVLIEEARERRAQLELQTVMMKQHPLVWVSKNDNPANIVWSEAGDFNQWMQPTPPGAYGAPWWDGEAWSPLNITAWDVERGVFTIETIQGDRMVTVDWVKKMTGLEVDRETGVTWKPCDCVACERARLRVGTTSSDVSPFLGLTDGQRAFRMRLWLEKRDKQKAEAKANTPMPVRALRGRV